MNEKRTTLLTAAVTPLLAPGEQLEVPSLAAVGTVSVKKQVAVAAATAALTLGTVAVMVRPKAFYVALTSQRLLFLNPTDFRGLPTDKIAMQVPRAAVVSVATFKRGWLRLKFDIAIAGQAKGLRLTFGRPNRDDGERVARALGWMSPVVPETPALTEPVTPAP